MNKPLIIYYATLLIVVVINSKYNLRDLYNLIPTFFPPVERKWYHWVGLLFWPVLYFYVCTSIFLMNLVLITLGERLPIVLGKAVKYLGRRTGRINELCIN